MMSRQRIFELLFLVSLCACQSSSKTDDLYKAAFEKQEEIINLIKDVRQLLDSDTSGINESTLLKVNELEEGLFPIPGYSLNLPGHEGHDHGHNRIELTAKEILTIQTDLLKQLRDIKWVLTYDK